MELRASRRLPATRSTVTAARAATSAVEARSSRRSSAASLRPTASTRWVAKRRSRAPNTNITTDTTKGIEQEFRGFGAADAIAVGDSIFHPTSQTRTYFYQGSKAGSIARDRLAENRARVSEGSRIPDRDVGSGAGTSYLSTTHSAYVGAAASLRIGRPRHLLRLRLRDRRGALRRFVAWVPGTGSLELCPRSPGRRCLGGRWDGYRRGQRRAGNDTIARRRPARISATTTDSVDNVGNVLQQTAHGRIDGSDGEIAERSHRDSHDPDALRATTAGSGGPRQTVPDRRRVDGNPANTSNNVRLRGTCDLWLTSGRRRRPNGCRATTFSGDGDGGRGTPWRTEVIEASTGYDAWGNRDRQLRRR